ncbi:MAG: BMP family ABC transporter substrate-binding protein, partial [Roseibium sp.]
MKKFLTIGTALAGLAFSVSGALAADIKPAVLYDLGGRFDKSFNESAYNGAEKFK